MLRIDVLGAPVVTVDGGPVRVDTRKATALLAVLAVALADGAGPVPREGVAALLWPEADGPRARGALRRTLSVLLAATGDAVVADRAGLHLEPARSCSDVVRFAQLRASDGVEDWATASGLVRGEFLAGFALRGCLPFDEWTAQRAAVLRRDTGALLERLVLARIRAGELHAALADGARWLTLDPLHEPAHRGVMRLLAWTGRRQDALDAYDRCVRVLAGELGVAPVRATTAVAEAIRSGTLAPPPSAARRSSSPPAGRGSAPHGHLWLPQGPSEQPHVSTWREAGRPGGELPLVGRERELAVLRSGEPLVVVTGETGAGRSRLLAEFARGRPGVITARVHEGEAGLAFAPVADLLREALAGLPEPLDPATAGEIARIVPDAVPGAPRVADTAGGRDRLFDAIVRALASARLEAVVLDDVHAISAAGAEFLSYLLHRLDRLGARLVLAWRSPGLPVSHPVRTALAARGAPAATVEAARLSRAEVAQLLHATGSTLDAEVLFERTAGLPLLLAAAVRAGRADDLGDVRDLLAARLGQVGEETRQVLAALAVCGGVAGPAVLRATSGRGEMETVEAVEEALGQGLIVEEGAALTFTHDALRRVTYDGLSLVRRRLLHTRAAEALAGGPATPGVVAHHWRLAGRDAEAATWGWAAARRAAAVFAHEEVLEHVQFVQAMGGDRAEVALAEGDACRAVGRYDEALVAYARAAALADHTDGVTRAAIERSRAVVHARVGAWEPADRGLCAALAALGDGAEHRAARAVLHADRALVALRARRPDAAGHARAALAESAPGESSQPYVRNAAGLVAAAAGRPDEARAAFGAALDAAGEPPLRVALLNNLSAVHAAAGDDADAVAAARDALALGVAQGDRHLLAALHGNLADRLHETGDAAGAREHMTRAATLFAEIGTDPLSHPDIWTLTVW